jgi:hypothetical protein
MDCLYQNFCTETLEGATEEHIFNSSWNGIMGVRDIIGQGCNNEFSSTLDTSFDPFVVRIKNARGLITERKSNPPPVQLVGGAKLRIHAQLSTTGSTHSDSFDAISNDDFDFDLKMQYRSTGHTCLKALAYYDPKLARSSIFDKTKSFIKNGDGDLNEFAIESTVHETFLPTRGQSLRGEFNHVVLYFSKRLNKVIGMFTLLGVVKRTIVLSDEWDKDECVITVGESVNKGISSRCWLFPVIDEGLPTIMEVSGLPDENSFKESERVVLKQYVASMSLSYKLTRHLAKLDRDKTLLTGKELEVIKKYAIELYSAALDRTGNTVSEEEIKKKVENSDLNSLLTEYNGKLMDVPFSLRLRDTGLEILASFDGRLKNVE